MSKGCFLPLVTIWIVTNPMEFIKMKCSFLGRADRIDDLYSIIWRNGIILIKSSRCLQNPPVRNTTIIHICRWTRFENIVRNSVSINRHGHTVRIYGQPIRYLLRIVKPPESITFWVREIHSHHNRLTQNSFNPVKGPGNGGTVCGKAKRHVIK